MNTVVSELTELEKSLLNDYQHDIGLSPTPYADMAEQLGVNEQLVITTLKGLKDRGFISRIGPVFRPNRIGISTLASMAIPEDELEQVAAIVNSFSEVNHNYQRDHTYNLWFVVTASDENHLNHILDTIELVTGYPLMSLPMLEDYFIDLGFNLSWT